MKMSDSPVEPIEDNLEVAMNAVADTIVPTRKSKTGSTPGDPASKQVLLRATDLDHQRWKDAADFHNISMAEFIRNACNEKAKEVLDCSHPTNMRRFYPWANVCLQCGMKIVTENQRARKPRAERGK